MSDSYILKFKGDRIYVVEFLRVFLILSIFLFHLGNWIDPCLKKDILNFFHTREWNSQAPVDCFFIIGGFFLNRRITLAGGGHIVVQIGKLWMRLMPGIIFCYLLLVLLGARRWWDFPLAFFPLAGYGISDQIIVGYCEWFMGVYFIVSCLYISLFSLSHKNAWFWLCVVMILCWCIQLNDKAAKGIGFGGMHYGVLADGTVRGLSCMALGIVASYLSDLWNPRKYLLLRIIATTFEVAALFMLFSFTYRRSCVHYNPIAVELATAMLLISAKHSWGYLSDILNRLSRIIYISRYTYSILLVQGMLVHFFRFNHNFRLEAHYCSLIICGIAIPFILIEYHFVERFLVPRIRNYLCQKKEE